ncbi:MAG: hypothetical protein H8E19_09265 [Deltaproteobacteria bacterium]|uniref:Porin n=1 Tax=Candidatus Desulfacyla euxinica TaxID=2841693 RepID=A0A8J6N019_9DELT|nr:hypothetical protein [Candidatus Desulfacyla euxinica]
MRVKIFRFWFLIPAILAVFATTVPAADVSDSAVQDEIKALKKMVLELQKRVRDLEADRMKPGAGVSPTVKTAEPEPSKRIPAKTSRPKIKAVVKAPPKAEEPIVAKAGAKAPAPLEIGGHQVRVGIAGAIQTDVIHDFNAVGLKPGGSVEREFITADIPVGGPAADITNRTGFSPNQSYLSGWAETDTPWGPFRVYADVNLMGSTTDAELQIYKAYGQWGWLKAGLDYTLWLNQATIPNTLDFEGPNAAPEVRFTQASIKIPLQPGSEKRGLFFTVGVEDAAGDITLPSGVADVTSVNQFPSVIGKLSYEPDWAHMELGGLYRRLKAEGTGYDQSIDGWGVTFSGNVTTWGNDNFIWGLEYGDALGAYMQDTAGLGLDAAPTSATNSTLKAISAFGAWAAYQHWWSKSLRSTATYGLVRLDSDFDLQPQTADQGTYKQTQYASMNLIWSPWPPFDVGLEYMFGHRTITDRTAVYGSTTGQNHRLQFTMRWNFDWER